MSIFTGLLCKQKGSVGQLTFRRVNGQTIFSEKVTEVSNPQTEAQMKQRTKWLNLVAFYKGIKPLLNRAVGGVWNSNHLYGYAADIRINNNIEGLQWFEWIKNNCDFDELIWETADGGNFWIHVAYRHERNRKKVVDFLHK